MSLLSKNRDRLLGILAIVFLIGGIANALEYFFGGLGYLVKNTGETDTVAHYILDDKKGGLDAETVVTLKGNTHKFILLDNAMKGGNLEVKKGDTITIYSTRFYQILYNYKLRGDILYVEQDGLMKYDNRYDWKSGAFYYMCFMGGCALFLGLIYLDVATKYSISDWSQRRLVNKQ